MLARAGQFLALLALVLGVALSLLLFFGEHRSAERAAARAHAEAVDRFALRMQQYLGSHERAALTMTALFTGGPEGLANLPMFGQRIRQLVPSLLAASWAPRVPPDALLDLEAALSARLGAPRRVFGPDGPVGDLDRDAYPVVDFYPASFGDGALGLDNAAFPVRLAAMRQAAATDRPAATQALTLVTQPGVQGSLVVSPVLALDGPRAAVGDDPLANPKLRGFAVLVFRLDRLLMPPGEESGLSVGFFDLDAPAGQRFLGARGGVEGGWEEGDLADARFEAADLTWGQRTWRALVRPPANGGSTARAGWLLVLGLTVTGAVTITLALTSHDAARLAREVEARRAAEALKDLAMREVDHRVKNSLQLVSALLEMQARGATPEVGSALGDASGRVRAIARLHERLYRDRDAAEARLSTVDLRSYLGSLVEDLGGGFPGWTLTCRAESVLLHTGSAVDLGLILVELVTNAVKHADPPPDLRRAEIALTARPDPGGFVLTVRDYGRGPPTLLVAGRAGAGLGTRIVRAFAGNLEATLQVADAAPGTIWTVARG